MRILTAKKTHTRLRHALCMFAVVATTGSTAIAQGTSQSAGVYLAGAERIVVGDDIRSLSQQIAVAACLHDANVDANTYGTVMTQSMAEYDALMDALINGNPAVGIDVAEDDRKILAALRGLSLQWDRFNAAVDAKLAGSTEGSGPDFVSRQNLNVMHSSKYLISELISRYSIPPALLQSDAFTLNIATRQRSLAMQIAKEACGVITGNRTLGNQNRLENAMTRFDLSLTALVNGFPAAGVSPAPTPEIRSDLTDIMATWTTAKTQLGTVSGPGDAATAARIYEQMRDISGQLDNLIPLYVTASKSGI
ncbi:type IV pili methyl-accepting chemotaxis transducer N-terminal domain-containing protein [Loktanella agnita]|uniref:type IV pili methyl-accepting chemotaxis transducer N-terminal domain-containing protein n=1 Tax=Loktanella agnita TaxID=287097 RepID=UPI003985769A